VLAVVLTPVLATASCTSHSNLHAAANPTTATGAGTTGAGTTSTTVAMQRFPSGQDIGLGFDHPRAWREFQFTRISDSSSLIVYLSNAALRDPCTKTTSAAGETTTCGEPLTALGPNGVLVSWSDIGYPGPGPMPAHPNTTVDGKPAEIVVTKPGDCARLGAAETLVADIARPAFANNYYEMVACIRGPAVGAQERLVRAMLESTRITG